MIQLLPITVFFDIIVFPSAPLAIIVFTPILEFSPTKTEPNFVTLEKGSFNIPS